MDPCSSPVCSYLVMTGLRHRTDKAISMVANRTTLLMPQTQKGASAFGSQICMVTLSFTPSCEWGDQGCRV